MADNNFVSYSNIEAILNEFNSKGVKVKSCTSNEVVDINLYGVKFETDTKTIYYRVDDATETTGYAWKEFTISGGLGDAKTGYVETRTIAGSEDTENYLHLGYWDSVYPADFPEEGKPGTTFDWENASDSELASAFTYVSTETGETKSMWHDAHGFTCFRVPAGGGSGGGEKSIITFTNKVYDESGEETFDIVSAIDGDTYIKFSATSVTKSGGASTGNYTTYIYRSENSSLIESELLKLTPVIQKSGCKQDETQSFNIKDYLLEGTYYYYVRIKDSLGTTYIIHYDVQAYEIGLEWDMPSFQYYGTSSKLVNFTLSGITGKQTRLLVYRDEETTPLIDIKTSQVEHSATILAQAHGVHRFKAWIEIETISGTVSTEDKALERAGVWVEEGIITPIMAFEKKALTGTQYMVSKINMIAVTPGQETSNVYVSDGSESLTVTIDTSVYSWNYISQTAGTKTIIAENHTGEEPYASDTCILTIEETSMVHQEYVQQLVMDVNPQGHTNEEAGIKTTFGYMDRTEVGNPMTPFTFSDNFNWSQGGFVTDSENGDATAFVIKKGTWIQFNGNSKRKIGGVPNGSLFLQSDGTSARDAGLDKGNGKNIEIIFQTKNVEDWDASLGKSWEDDTCGLKLDGHSLTFASSTNSLSAQYSENKLTEISINIKPQDDTTLATYSTMKIWMAGTPARAATYSDTKSGGTSFAHVSGDPFRIGSDNCDIWLYRFKMYLTGLSDSNIISNFIVDTPNPSDKISRDLRNDIYVTGISGTINKNKMTLHNPNLHVISIEASKFPPKKGGSGKIDCKISHIVNRGGNTEETKDYPDEEQWWTEPSGTSEKPVYAKYTLQGTSSMNYREAAGNLDIDMKKCYMYYTDSTTQTKKELEKGYKLYDKAVPEKYFNMKANVASSENANNICLVDLYNTFNPFTSRQKGEAASSSAVVRDTNYGEPCAVFLKNTGTERLQLGVDGARWIEPGGEILYYAGDFLNSKKNVKTLGQTDYANGQMCIEFAENNYKKCLFQEITDFGDENWEFSDADWTDIKAAYPWIENPTNRQIRGEQLHQIKPEQLGQEIDCHVKYYIKYITEETHTAITRELIHTTALGESKVTCQLANKNIVVDSEKYPAEYPVAYTESDANVPISSVTSTGTIIIDVTGIDPATKVYCNYYYQKEIPEYVNVSDNAEIISTTSDGAIRIKIKENAQPNDYVLVDYNFDRNNQFALRYPEDEWYQGFYLVEGGIKREELKTDEHRRYFDFYSKAKERFVTMHNDISSTTPFPKSDEIPAGYTGAELTTPASERTYGGVEYKYDNEAYRLARYKLDNTHSVGYWFDLQQLAFHYLFTEFFSMVDNRAKNTFCSWEENNKGTKTSVTGEVVYTVKKDDTEKGTQTNKEIYTIVAQTEQVEVQLDYKNIETFTLLAPYEERLISIDKEKGIVKLNTSGMEIGETFKATYTFWLDAIRVPLVNSNVYYDEKIGLESGSFVTYVNGVKVTEGTSVFRVYTEGYVYLNTVALSAGDVITMDYSYRKHSSSEGHNGWSFNFSKDYDNDTAIGIDNKGKLMLDYGIESTDQDSSGNYWFNGAKNTIFWNFYKQYRNLITDQFIEDEAECFGATTVIKKFYNYQKIRPEALMADDAKGKYDDPITNKKADGNYNKNTSFMVDMELGEKIDQRYLFLTFQQRYYASKYSLADSGSHSSAWTTEIKTQVHGPGTGQTWNSEIYVIPYSDLYVEVSKDNQTSLAKSQRVKHNQQVKLDVGAAPTGEVNYMICSGHSIKYVSSLANWFLGQYMVSGCNKLQYVLLGNSDATYVPAAVQFAPGIDAAIMAKEIDLQGQSGLSSQAQSLELTSNPLLEKLNTKNSAVTSVVFSEGSPLTEVKLGSSTQTISAINIKTLDEANFSLDKINGKYQNLNYIHLDNCYGFPVADLLNNTPKAITSGAQFEIYVNIPTDKTVTFSNCAVFKPVLNGDVVWKGNPKTFETAPTIRGYIKGKLHFNLLGSYELAELNSYFDNMVTITYDTLVEGYSIYPVRYYNEVAAGGALLYTEYIKSGEKTTDPVVRRVMEEPQKAETIAYKYTYKKWDFDFNTPITSATNIYATYTAELKSYDVQFKWSKNSIYQTYFHFENEKIYTVTGEEPDPTIVSVALKGNHLRSDAEPTFTPALVGSDINKTTGIGTIDVTGISAGTVIYVSYDCIPVYTVNTPFGSTATYDIASWGIPTKTDMNTINYDASTTPTLVGSTEISLTLREGDVPVSWVPTVCTLTKTDASTINCYSTFNTTTNQITVVFAETASGSRYVFADGDKLTITYAVGDYLCTGFSKSIETQSYLTASIDHLVDESFVTSYGCQVVSDFEQIKVPSFTIFNSLSWAQVVAILNTGHSSDGISWRANDSSGAEKTWLKIYNRGTTEEEAYSKTITCHNGDSYLIRPEGFLKDRYSSDSGITYKSIPATFSTVNLSNINMPFSSSSKKGWINSDIRAYLNGTNENNNGNFLVNGKPWTKANSLTLNSDKPYIYELPIDLQAAIQTCCKQNMTPGEYDEPTWQNITYDKLFLPSAIEVGADMATFPTFVVDHLSKDPSQYPSIYEKNRQLPQITYYRYLTTSSTNDAERRRYQYGTETTQGWITRHNSSENAWTCNVRYDGSMVQSATVESIGIRYYYRYQSSTTPAYFPIFFCVGIPRE